MNVQRERYRTLVRKRNRLSDIDRLIQSEARTDANVDFDNGVRRTGLSNTARRRIENALSMAGLCVIDDECGRGTVTETARDEAYGQYLAEYSRIWDLFAKNKELVTRLETKRRAAAERASTLIGRIEEAARREAQDAFFTGITEPASMPMTEAAKKAIREAVEAGFVFGDEPRFEPFAPVRDEKALRVFQAAYNQHLRGLR